MKPERINYEIWILDYLDGRLNEEQTGLLMKFLDENPDIREEFNFLAGYKTMPEYVNYPGKNKLKRTISDLPEDQFELLCVSVLENDLSAEQTGEFLKYLEEHPDKRKKFDQLQKIKLKPPSVEFRNKNKIRKPGVADKTIRYLIPALSAAACLAITIWILSSVENNNNNTMTVSDREIQTNKESFTMPQASAPLRTEAFTAEFNLNIIAENTIEHAPVIPASEPVENIDRKNITLYPLTFKDNLILHQVAIDNMKLEIKLKSPETVTEETSNGVKYFLTKFVREKILKTNSAVDEAIKPYEIAEAGIKGLNKILGWQMSFNGYTDEKGELMAINFDSKLLKLNIPVKRNELDE